MNKTPADLIHGIHHVTAIARDPQKNVDFYSGVLGLRLVKKTVNFDDPFTYHFYFGDEVGNPGTIITFFPWPSATFNGRNGTGHWGGVSFDVPAGSLGFWKRRFEDRGIEVSTDINSWGEEALLLRDPDGCRVELVASSDPGPSTPARHLPASAAIRGIRGVLLTVAGFGATERFLAGALGAERAGEKGNRLRFKSGSSLIELCNEPEQPAGIMGPGVIHHVAFRTGNRNDQFEVREMLAQQGLSVTTVIDRNYFHSIYFNDPSGAICEVATDPPGFLVDENPEELGTGLKLPRQYEPYRSEIERTLPPVSTESRVVTGVNTDTNN